MAERRSPRRSASSRHDAQQGFRFCCSKTRVITSSLELETVSHPDPPFSAFPQKGGRPWHRNQSGSRSRLCGFNIRAGAVGNRAGGPGVLRKTSRDICAAAYLQRQADFVGASVPDNAELKNKIQSVKDIADLLPWLNTKAIRASVSRLTQPAEQITPSVLERLISAKAGDIIVVPTDRQMSLCSSTGLPTTY
jgi:hypothetical protein